jgi:hypothetical protein
VIKFVLLLRIYSQREPKRSLAARDQQHRQLNVSSNDSFSEHLLDPPPLGAKAKIETKARRLRSLHYTQLDT